MKKIPKGCYLRGNKVVCPAHPIQASSRNNVIRSNNRSSVVRVSAVC